MPKDDAHNKDTSGGTADRLEPIHSTQKPSRLCMHIYYELMLDK